MALSKVQNLASILSNNALAGGQIENSFNMFEAPPNNCSTDTRHGEYDPWSYDLLGRNSNKAPLEDEEAQDLNNSMVNDLVAKILDDDPIVTEETFGNGYNGNARSYEMQNSRMLKGRNASLGNYHDEIGISQIYYPYNKLPNVVTSQDDNHREFVNMCSALNSMSLNDCIAQTLEKTNDYGSITSSNCERTILGDQQQQLRARVSNDITNVPLRNYATVTNNLLTTTNGQNYAASQSSNWSDTVQSHDYTNDLFSNYQTMQNSTNHDMNYNTITLAEMDLRSNIGNNLTPNQHHHRHHHYNNQSLNVPNSYNPTTANSQNFRPSSSINELTADTVFNTNSPMQHFSPSESALQNCLSTNYSRNNYEDYKEIHDNTSINMSNAMQNDSLYLQQQQQQQQQQNSYKLDRQMDQNYKALMNRFLSLSDFNVPPNGDICSIDCSPMTVNHNHRIEANLLKVISPRSTKNRDSHNNQTSSKLRGYPKNLSGLQFQNNEQPNTDKYNYHVHNGYQHYTANNSESLKAVPPNSPAYPAPLKRASLNQCSYKIDPYDLANEIPFNGNAHLAQQIARASMEHNVFNQIMKQRHQQIQRMPGVPGAGVLLNARLMRPGNPQAPNSVFPSVMPVVQVPVPSINTMSVLFGGLNLRNGARPARRAGASSVLHFRLEQTFEQFKQLEKERKKCEAGLADHFPGKRVSSANNIPIPRLQGNSSRADRLIVDHFQEHARVITLIAKMEHLRGATMSERIHKAMEYWLEAIKYVQECRKKEIEFANMRRKESRECVPMNDDKHVLALAVSVHQLTKASRMARTAMNNALQSTLLHDKDFERTIVEKSIDPIVPGENEGDGQTSTNGEIGQFTKST
ncbi:GATA zinc finger domain-containing protein 14-like isoform X2 [Venturia canescens]|uniref:GATA zinc finger domain-containing protein 14-like isoform X2 n=1 Tax=Venturia canescens TaxID=32260 RepID=UPI001C9C6A5B|nr:GATA zinc finger domain-containing protein 14-like isoform X2 [Venturia canescens]XP_043268091.1 GATA zinc finger domain-containing protein 14-like isoform X2 [Venturia canescens]XP_043268092.1 GATA zinc finger domain-containing protein 14-like isoform X2 [Venturia canescens]XP_043268094.1 GATA zinc finger domain-containing protein 14-like isoform X2 [Venturia canescens]